MRRLALLFPFLLSLPFTAAFAHDDDQEANEIRVLMGEMFFQVDGQDKNTPLRLKSGARYELVFENAGQMKHEVLLGRDVIEDDGRPRNYREHLLAAVPVDVEIKTTVAGEEREIEIETNGIIELELDPGVRIAVNFKLPSQTKGEWELGCFIAGHYEAGMRLPLLVE